MGCYNILELPFAAGDILQCTEADTVPWISRCVVHEGFHKK